MTPLYATFIVVAVVGLIVWLVMVAVASSVEGWESKDPETRWGHSGRMVLAGIFGFGLAGMSALYAGSSAPVSLVGAAVGGVAMVFVSKWLGPDAAA